MKRNWSLATKAKPSWNKRTPTARARSFFTEMDMRKRRWHSARRACNAHLASYDRLPEARRTNMFGYLHYVFAKRALIHVILGRYQDAEADIAESRAVAAKRPPNWFSPLYLALAEAALAYSRGEYQIARAKLQSTVGSPERRPHFVHEEIQVLLVAARIARAEGSRAGFEHYCGKAAALCEEHDLPISAKSVEAVRNGAEY